MEAVPRYIGGIGHLVGAVARLLLPGRSEGGGAPWGGQGEARAIGGRYVRAPSASQHTFPANIWPQRWPHA